MQHESSIANRKSKMPDQAVFAFVSAAVPRGDGSFIVPAPKPLAKEISAREAARLLGIHRDSVRFAIETALGRELLKWRWTSPHKKKRLFETASVLEYRKALGVNGEIEKS